MNDFMWWKPWAARVSDHLAFTPLCNTTCTNFWTQFKNVHLRGPCSLRLCISVIEHLMKLNPNVDNKNLITKLGIEICICITKIVIRHHSHICAGVLWKKNPSGYGFSFYKLATITPKYIYIICRCLFPATTFLFFFQALNKKKVTQL